MARRQMEAVPVKTYPVSPGSRYPFGATPDSGGVNFSIFSRNASAAELLLFADADSREPFQVVALDRERNRTFYSWHVYVEGLPPGTYRLITGFYDAETGQRLPTEDGGDFAELGQFEVESP